MVTVLPPACFPLKARWRLNRVTRRARRSRSFRQLFAGLLAHQVLGIPVRPVLIVLAASALLMLAVGRSRTTKRARQILRRGEACRRGVDAAGQPCRNLLKEPAVAVRIMERGKGAIATM